MTNRILCMAVCLFSWPVFADSGFTDDNRPCEIQLENPTTHENGEVQIPFKFSVGSQKYRPNRSLLQKNGSSSSWKADGIANWEVNPIVGRQSATDFSLELTTSGFVATLQYVESLLDGFGNWTQVFYGPTHTVTCTFSN